MSLILSAIKIIIIAIMIQVHSWWPKLKTYARDEKNISDWREFANDQDFPDILSHFLFSSEGTRFELSTYCPSTHPSSCTNHQLAFTNHHTLHHHATINTLSLTDDATITFTRFKKDFIFEAPLYLHICNIYNICNIFRFKKDSIFEASLYLHICNNCNICNIFRFKKDSIFEAPSYLHIFAIITIFTIFSDSRRISSLRLPYICIFAIFTIFTVIS